MKTLLVASLAVLALGWSAGGAAAQAPQKDPVVSLAQQLKDPDAALRRAAARALTRLPNTNPAIPALIEALKDSDPVVRDNTVDALCVMPPGDVLPSLIRAMRDPNALSRRRAAEAVGRIKNDTEPAWPALIELLKDESIDVRKSAHWALRRVLGGRWD